MPGDTNNARLRNLLLIILLLVTTVFTAYQEGFLPKISPYFWVTIIAGFSVSIWLALSISTKRLLALIVVIFIIEYIKETIGIRSNMWTYHGVDGLYNFGIWAWVLAGLVAYTFSTKIVIKQLRKLKFPLLKYLNPVIIIVVAAIIPLTLGDYRSEAGGWFYSFYALLLIAGIYTSIRVRFSVIGGIVVIAWVVGNPSEYVGSVTSGVWTFTHNPDYPPFFLLFGCWPLEILAQYSLSAFLANEPLDADTA